MDVLVSMEKKLMDIMEWNDVVNTLIPQKLRFSELRDDVHIGNTVYFAEYGFITHKRKITEINSVINEMTVDTRENIVYPMLISGIDADNFLMFLEWDGNPQVEKGIIPDVLPNPYRMVFPVPYGLNPDPKYSAPSCPFCKSHSTNCVVAEPHRGMMWCAECGGIY